MPLGALDADGPRATVIGPGAGVWVPSTGVNGTAAAGRRRSAAGFGSSAGAMPRYGAAVTTRLDRRLSPLASCCGAVIRVEGQLNVSAGGQVNVSGVGVVGAAGGQ